jgi:replicative DNA helicase
MSDPMTDRLPPHNKDAEKGVIGGILRDPDELPTVQQIIKADNFYFDAHQKIFQAVCDLSNENHPIDLVMLHERLKLNKQLDDVGGVVYLTELWESVPTGANAEYHAKIVRDTAMVRSLIHASTEILRDSYDRSQSADELVSQAERKIMDIAKAGMVGETKTLTEAVHEAFARIDSRAGKDNLSISGLATGYVDLDNILAGLQNSELVIIAARPSVGKTALSLNLVRNVITNYDPSQGERGPVVLFVSLEMSRIELAERLLCCEARVDSHKVRKGHLSSDDIQKLMDAGDVLRKARLYLDDTPSRSMIQIAATARRLQKKHERDGGLRLVVIDYLQLIEPENRRDPRQEQVAQISRRLKFLARELAIPVVALAQVNRASEDRQDHKPRLADLRESGCLTGDTLIGMADTGERIPLRSLVGRSGFRVWALNEDSLKLEAATVSRAFSTGVKPVFRLETRLGRVIRGTANHQFRGFAGWKRLDELELGERIALPRVLATPTVPGTLESDEAALLGHLIGDGCTLPRHAIQYTTADRDLADEVAELAVTVFPRTVTPRVRRERDWYQVYLSSSERLTHGKRNPIAVWLDDMGVFGLRSWEKRVPENVFRQPASVVARFLRHLWATDGSVRPPQGKTRHPSIYYASSSERLAHDVQELLLRFGINAVLRSYDQGKKGRTQFHVMVMGHDDILAFADRVGAVGQRKSVALTECRLWLEGRPANPNRDTIPRDVWLSHAKPAMQRNGVTMRAMQSAMQMSFAGTGLYKANVSRARLSRVADAVGGDERIRKLAESDVYWDEVISITPDGEEEVFDLTVPGPHNFVANGFVVHNSLEQDADTVMILHRPGRFDGTQEDNILEVIIAKQRNGPTGEVTLTYLKQFNRYENYIADAGYGDGGL